MNTRDLQSDRALEQRYREESSETLHRINRLSIPPYVVLMSYLAFFADKTNFPEYHTDMFVGRIVSIIISLGVLVVAFVPSMSKKRGNLFGLFLVLGAAFMLSHFAAVMDNHFSAQTAWIVGNIVIGGLYPLAFIYTALVLFLSYAYYFVHYLVWNNGTMDLPFQMTVLNSMGAGIIALAINYGFIAIRKREFFSRIKLERANEQIANLNEQLKDENVRMAAELDVARRIQHIVLPDESGYRDFSDLDIACTMVTADEVGGDYYDVLYFEQDGIIAIGDVTGHGLNSGIIMMMVHTALRALSEIEREDIITLYTVINRVCYDFRIKTDDTRIMTLALLRYLGDGRFQMTGEHENFLHFRNNGECETVPVEFGMYAGLEREIGKHLKVHEFEIEPGETLILYTDGVTEAVDAGENEFGLKGMADSAQPFLRDSARRVRDGIIMACRDHTGQGTLYDDYSLVVIQRKRT